MLIVVFFLHAASRRSLAGKSRSPTFILWSGPQPITWQQRAAANCEVWMSVLIDVICTFYNLFFFFPEWKHQTQWLLPAWGLLQPTSTQTGQEGRRGGDGGARRPSETGLVCWCVHAYWCVLEMVCALPSGQWHLKWDWVHVCIPRDLFGLEAHRAAILCDKVVHFN